MPLLTPPTLWDGVFLTWHHHVDDDNDCYQNKSILYWNKLLLFVWTGLIIRYQNPLNNCSHQYRIRDRSAGGTSTGHYTMGETRKVEKVGASTSNLYEYCIVPNCWLEQLTLCPTRKWPLMRFDQSPRTKHRDKTSNLSRININNFTSIFHLF